MAATAAFRRSQVESSKSAGRTGAAERRKERGREEEVQVSEEVDRGENENDILFRLPGSLLLRLVRILRVREGSPRWHLPLMEARGTRQSRKGKKRAEKKSSSSLLNHWKTNDSSCPLFPSLSFFPTFQLLEHEPARRGHGRRGHGACSAHSHALGARRARARVGARRRKRIDEQKREEKETVTQCHCRPTRPALIFDAAAHRHHRSVGQLRARLDVERGARASGLRSRPLWFLSERRE